MHTFTVVPTPDQIDRVCAGHAIELAMSVTPDPSAILQLAQFHYEKMLGADTAWPAREILH